MIGFLSLTPLRLETEVITSFRPTLTSTAESSTCSILCYYLVHLFLGNMFINSGNRQEVGTFISISFDLDDYSYQLLAFDYVMNTTQRSKLIAQLLN